MESDVERVDGFALPSDRRFLVRALPENMPTGLTGVAVRAFPQANGVHGDYGRRGSTFRTCRNRPIRVLRRAAGANGLRAVDEPSRPRHRRFHTVVEVLIVNGALLCNQPRRWGHADSRASIGGY